MFAPKWKPEEVDRVRVLWEAGYSAGRIAHIFDPTGATSRSAIIGLVNRNDMKAKKKLQPEITWTPELNHRLEAAVKAGMRATEIALALDPTGVLTPGAVKRQALRLGSQATDKAIVPIPPPVKSIRVRIEPPRPSRPCVLTKLTATSCRWPIGDDAPFLFCNETQDDHSSYCPAHHAFSLR